MAWFSKTPAVAPQGLTNETPEDRRARLMAESEAAGKAAAANPFNAKAAAENIKKKNAVKQNMLDETSSM